MAVVHKVYPHGMKNILNGNINLVTGTLKVALLNGTAYNAAHENWSSVSGGQVVSANYTAGGMTLAMIAGGITVSGETISVKSSNAETVFTAKGSISATQAVIYESVGNRLISHIDFGGTRASVDGEWKITWHANGQFRVTTNPV